MSITIALPMEKITEFCQKWQVTELLPIRLCFAR